jgi:hypothetical protein
VKSASTSVVAEAGAGLPIHRIDEVVVFAILRVKSVVRDVPTQIAKVEPLVGEILDESLEAFVGDQSFDFGVESRGDAQLAARRELAKAFVGGAVVKQMREP